MEHVHQALRGNQEIIALDPFLKSHPDLTQAELFEALEAESLAEVVKSFSAASIHLIAQLRATRRIKRRISDVAPQLGDFYFLGELDDPQIKALFNVPNVTTSRSETLRFFLNPEAPSHARFLVYSMHKTGGVLVGETSGSFRSENLEIHGHVPETLVPVVKLIQEKVIEASECNIDRSQGIGYMQFNLNFSAQPSIPLTFLFNNDGTLQITHHNKVITEVPGFSKDKPKTKTTEPEKHLYWEGQWHNEGTTREYRFPEFINKLNDDGITFGPHILELGSKNKPVSRHIQGAQAVSIDLGMPQGYQDQENPNIKFLQGNANNLEALLQEHHDAISDHMNGGVNSKKPIAGYDTVMMSNLLNYADTPGIFRTLSEKLKPGAKILVQNDVTQGEEEFFADTYVKNNKALVEQMKQEGLKVTHIYVMVDKTPDMKSMLKQEIEANQVIRFETGGDLELISEEDLSRYPENTMYVCLEKVSKA